MGDPHLTTDLTAKTLLGASCGLLEGCQRWRLQPWQRQKTVIQCSHGTAWEGDDRKGLGCHCLRAVAFAVVALPSLSHQKIQEAFFCNSENGF